MTLVGASPPPKKQTETKTKTEKANAGGNAGNSAASSLAPPPQARSAMQDASWLGPPLTVFLVLVVLMYCVRSIVTPFAIHVWRRDPPIVPVTGADVVVAMNLARHVSEEECLEAVELAKIVWKAAPNKPRAGMTSAAPNGFTQEELDRARSKLGDYFESAFAAMFRSQLRVLRTIARRNVVTTGDVTVYYDQAAESGAGIAFRDWLDYLDRYGFVDMSTSVGGIGMTSVGISDLGRIFLGWCDAKGLSPESLAGNGRQF